MVVFSVQFSGLSTDKLNPEIFHGLTCGELRTQIYIAQRLHEKLGNDESKLPADLIAETKEISAMLQGLIRSIEQRS